MRGRAAFLSVSAWSLANLLLAISPTSNLSETIERWEHLRVDRASTVVSNLGFSSGNLTLMVRSGSASVVRAGEEAVGIYLSGAGTLDYSSVDRIEFPLLLHNVRAATSLSVEKGEKRLRIADTFTEMLWLAAGRSLPELEGSPGPSLEAGFQKQIERLRHVRMTPISHVFALQKLDNPSSPLVLASFSGGKADLAYRFDEGTDRSERLYFLRKSTSSDPEVKNDLSLTPLSEQPVGRDRRDPQPPAFLLTDVRVEVHASSGNDATVTAVETVVPQKRRQSVLRFHLYSTIYAWVGSGVRSPRSFRLRDVTDESGHSLRFHHAGEDLVVGLAEPAEPDHPVKLKFQIDGDFLVRPGGDNFWILGLGPWFPQPRFGGQYYTWHAQVKVKKPFLPFSSGTTVSRRSEGDANIVETETDKPVQFAIVLAGSYEFEEETKNGVKIRVASYAFHNGRAMKQLASLAGSIIEYYEAFLGPFPFPEFQILEINEYGFGVAPPGVMFITKEAFNPLIGEKNQLFSGGVNERFAHEIAHQYWGHVVKMPSLEEQWLTESFAEYSAALFLRQFKGKSTYDSLVAHWKARAQHARDVAPIPLANEIYEPTMGNLLRTELLYDKGPYLLAALHRELGDDTFLTFFKSYQKSFRWKFGSTKTVEGLLQFLTKKDYGPFFESNYWGTGMPSD